jgi:hypothetical protein
MRKANWNHNHPPKEPSHFEVFDDGVLIYSGNYDEGMKLMEEVSPIALMKAELEKAKLQLEEVKKRLIVVEKQRDDASQLLADLDDLNDRTTCVHFVPTNLACEECAQNKRSTLSERYLELLSLVDGAKTIVEIYTPVGKFNTGWRKNWLSKVRELLTEYEKNNANSYEQRGTGEL